MKLVSKLQTKWRNLLSNEKGGVSPIVVTVGFALIALAVILAASPTLRGAISSLIQKVIDGLNTL